MNMKILNKQVNSSRGNAIRSARSCGCNLEKLSSADYGFHVSTRGTSLKFEFGKVPDEILVPSIINKYKKGDKNGVFNLRRSN